MSEPVITFGQLCAIKREKMGLMMREVEEMIGYKNLSNVENGVNTPRYESRKKLIDFYKITDAELKNLKPTKNKALPSIPVRIEKVSQVIRTLDELIDSASDLKETGQLGALVAEQAEENLRLARDKVSELGILDKLL